MINLDDVGVVIQGPTNYCDAILNNIDTRIKHIWSTWSTEPIENLRKINSKVDLLVSHPPQFSGNRNINMQCLSSLRGAEALDKKYIVKVRGDLLWSGQSKLIELAFEDIEKKNSIAAFLNYKPSISQIHDFVSFSSRENALKIWGYTQGGYSSMPPEEQLVNHMMSTFKLDYSSLVKNMSFINTLMQESVIDLYCIKYNVSLGNQCNTDLFGVPSFPKKQNV